MRHDNISEKLLAMAAILVVPFAAAAQVVPNTSQEGSAPANTPAAESPSTVTSTIDSSAIGEIVVTAQKRSQSIQKIPVTVAALTGTALTQSGVKDLFQAVTLVPGITFSRAPDDGLALNFRGLGTTARPAGLRAVGRALH